MPAQQRLGPDEQPVAARAGQQPGESGQHRAVSPVQSGSGHLSAEHRDLVPQHQQLHIVDRRAPRQQHQPSQQLAEDQIEQSKRHPSIIGSSVSLSEVAAQSLRPTFWHPEAPEAKFVLVAVSGVAAAFAAGVGLTRLPMVARPF
jgi:hypothetical protein